MKQLTWDIMCGSQGQGLCAIFYSIKFLEVDAVHSGVLHRNFINLIHLIVNISISVSGQDRSSGHGALRKFFLQQLRDNIQGGGPKWV